MVTVTWILREVSRNVHTVADQLTEAGVQCLDLGPLQSTCHRLFDNITKIELQLHAHDVIKEIRFSKLNQVQPRC